MGKRSNKRKKRKKKLRQQNSLTNRDITKELVNNKQMVSVNNQNLLFIISEFLQRWTFPVFCFVYALVFLIGLLNKNDGIHLKISLFMGLFSVSIAVFFSNFFEEIYIKIFSKTIFFCKVLSLIQFAFVVLITYVIWYYCGARIILYPRSSDIFTWLSIVIFFVDKNIHKKWSEIKTQNTK